MNDTVTLWDWRRRIADLHAAIRGNPDPEAAWRHWHATRADLFATHAQSPVEQALRASHPGPKRYPYDPALRFLARLAPFDAASEHIEAGSDGAVTLSPFARTLGLEASLGAELTLYWIAGYGGGAFLPFADATNGQETYGGGRYLLDTIKGADLGTSADGRLVLDFNFAYFPSCAYSDRYTCPLAPPANRLPGAVRAGERL